LNTGPGESLRRRRKGSVHCARPNQKRAAWGMSAYGGQRGRRQVAVCTENLIRICLAEGVA
jgi:hypothetical protein